MYNLINKLKCKMVNNNTKINIPQQTETVRNCEECLNHETLIVDTNCIFFLMDFISKYYPNLESDEFIAKLKGYFQQSSECAIDGSLYVSKRLFNYELDVNYNPACSLNTESLFLENNPDEGNRNDLVDMFNNSIEIRPINQEDLDKIIFIAGIAYGERAPKLNDLSLVTLGLNLSNDADSKCLIITDDEQLKKLIKDQIQPKGKIEKANGDEWESTRLLQYHILDFLLKIFRCCKLTYKEADKMVYYYGEHFLFKRWGDLFDELKEIKARYISYYGKVLREYIRDKYQIED